MQYRRPSYKHQFEFSLRNINKFMKAFEQIPYILTVIVCFIHVRTYNTDIQAVLQTAMTSMVYDME